MTLEDIIAAYHRYVAYRERHGKKPAMDLDTWVKKICGWEDKK